MSSETWNADEGLVEAEDMDELGSVWRYGVTGWEATHPEPLSVALAQERPDTVPVDDDEQWSEIDGTDPFAGRLIEDAGTRDDDYALAVDDVDDFAPEELAMHLVEP